MPKPVDPVVTGRRDAHTDSEETHPAYALIGCSRVNSNGQNLYGSDFRHRDFMTITIRRSSRMRSVNHDYHSGGHELIEVALSEAQWATFVSTPNSGMGVPCTLQFVAKQAGDEPTGWVPGIASKVDRKVEARGEMSKLMETSRAHVRNAAEAIQKSSLSAKAKEAIIAELNMATRDVGTSIDWVAKCFDEHMERTVEKAKTEVAAYVTATVVRAGLQALGVEPVKLLDEGGEE
jgi:hypothetical protein